jgi:hypothetical protein
MDGRRGNPLLDRVTPDNPKEGLPQVVVSEQRFYGIPGCKGWGADFPYAGGSLLVGVKYRGNRISQAKAIDPILRPYIEGCG